MHIKNIVIDASELNPTLMRMYFFNQSQEYFPGEKLEKRHVLDFEFEFFTESTGGMYIDDTYYTIQAGDVVLKRPGQFTRAVMPYSCYLLGIDPTDRAQKIQQSTPYIMNGYFVPYYRHHILDQLPTRIHPKQPQIFAGLFEEILKERLNPSKISTIKIKNLIMSIIIHMYEETVENNVNQPSPYRKTFQLFKEYVENHLDEQLTLDQIAKQLKVSPAHFHKIYKKTFQQTPNEYILQERLKKSKELLIRSDQKIIDIALTIGFASATYFSTVFKKYEGMTPREYRKQYTYY